MHRSEARPQCVLTDNKHKYWRSASKVLTASAHIHTDAPRKQLLNTCRFIFRHISGSCALCFLFAFCQILATVRAQVSIANINCMLNLFNSAIEFCAFVLSLSPLLVRTRISGSARPTRAFAATHAGAQKLNLSSSLSSATLAVISTLVPMPLPPFLNA